MNFERYNSNDLTLGKPFSLMWPDRSEPFAIVDHEVVYRSEYTKGFMTGKYKMNPDERVWMCDYFNRSMYQRPVTINNQLLGHGMSIDINIEPEDFTTIIQVGTTNGTDNLYLLDYIVIQSDAAITHQTNVINDMLSIYLPPWVGIRKKRNGVHSTVESKLIQNHQNSSFLSKKEKISKEITVYIPEGESIPIPALNLLEYTWSSFMKDYRNGACKQIQGLGHIYEADN